MTNETRTALVEITRQMIVAGAKYHGNVATMQFASLTKGGVHTFSTPSLVATLERSFKDYDAKRAVFTEAVAGLPGSEVAEIYIEAGR